jgi:hypothetical protein
MTLAIVPQIVEERFYMNDHEIVERIDTLVAEEHRLEREHGATGLSEGDRDKLSSIEVQLDQCWDLLRQRRARRNAGKDPSEAEVRAAEVVERYQQ